MSTRTAGPLGHTAPIEYLLIENYFEGKRANIDEGIGILQEMQASSRAVRAFCIHPIVQDHVILEAHTLDDALRDEADL